MGCCLNKSYIPFPLEAMCPFCKISIDCLPLWQGIHICVKGLCPSCKVTIVQDVPVGQALYTPYTVCLERKRVFGDEQCREWFGRPLLDSLLAPNLDEVGFSVERLLDTEDVIIINCLDYLYGHSLLKLLNADGHLRDNKGYGLVVIVPNLLRWMVPEGVAEIWTVDLPLGKMRGFYPDLDRKIKRECKRFSDVRLSLAYSHPSDFNIQNFTGVSRHDFSQDNPRITFIWRNDRLWYPADLFFRLLRRIGLARIVVWWQRVKVIRLFACLKHVFPSFRFTVAGVGRDCSFPSWIEDHRVEPPLSSDQEKELCRIYAESRVVIGIHGSNMLLPSAHAGIVIDLMPKERWGNLAQDNLTVDKSRYFLLYRTNFIPLGCDISEISQAIFSLVSEVGTVRKISS
ncbi:hypothetical protein D6779_11165 [Candidatus Parcubacteria bacterium]|nr:MAG: hypothetical protein D6779_11165 [Candidatus Parcubacteria bacterium]